MMAAACSSPSPYRPILRHKGEHRRRGLLLSSTFAEEQRCVLPLSCSSRRRVAVEAAAAPPPPDDDDRSLFDAQASLSKAQDGMRIFFAVLFWMILFFWAGAWDGQDKGGPNKSSRFRREGGNQDDWIIDGINQTCYGANMSPNLRDAS